MKLSNDYSTPFYNSANLAAINRNIEKTIQRISTGSRLNSAKDNVANIQVAAKLKSEIAGATAFTQNASTALSMLTTADEVLSEAADVVNRITELGIQGSNSALTSSQSTELQSEVSSLAALLTNLSSDTTYNGTALLDGTFSSQTFQIGPATTSSVTVSLQSIAASSLGAYQVTGSTRAATTAASSPTANDTSANEDVTIAGTTVEASANDSAKAMTTKINAVSETTGVTATAETFALLETSDGTATTYTIKINDTSTASFSISSSDPSGAVAAINAISASTGVTAAATSASKVLLHDADGDDITIENADSDSGLSVTALQLDGSTAQGSAVSLAASGGNDSTRVIGTVRLSSSATFSVTQAGTASQGYFASGDAALSGLSTASVATTANARNAITIANAALEQISAIRGSISAASSQLEFSSFANERMRSEKQRGLANISDSDIALESAKLAKAQMLKQATLALQSHARADDELIISLIKSSQRY